jgi:hypothetical protein
VYEETCAIAGACFPHCGNAALSGYPDIGQQRIPVREALGETINRLTDIPGEQVEKLRAGRVKSQDLHLPVNNNGADTVTVMQDGVIIDEP